MTAELRAHRAWIDTIAPVGIVVSPPALVAAGAVLERDVASAQERLEGLLARDELAGGKPAVPDFLAFAEHVLGWDTALVAGASTERVVPEELEVALPAFGETLRPMFAVQSADGDWQLCVRMLPRGTRFDDEGVDASSRWRASPQSRLERLLRDSATPAGLLFDGEAVRLVYAPRGESSGHMTWTMASLRGSAGRPLLAALRMLLGAPRLFEAPRAQRLSVLLRQSRAYQSVVSTALAAQVLEGLNELLRGFQAANDAGGGKLLDELVRDDPSHVYGGLLAVLLRLVFVLYAEERGLVSSDPIYVANYAVGGLYDKLRADAARYPDSMDQRHGAWARVCASFRLVFEGARHGTFELPARSGHLFDPATWPFLEGRGRESSADAEPMRVAIPRVSDGVVHRVLEKLSMLDGERLSYRALDVEQIGSVYENMMGFTLERATEVSIGLGREHVVVGLASLLTKAGPARADQLAELADVRLTGKAAVALAEARSIDDLVVVLAKRVSPLTPRPLAVGGLYLQPSDERRRSGSHYTPRELTEPIVRTTLRPILEALGPTPRPEAILDLTICDPAMGSGAFLVETCRQLAEPLLSSWDLYGRPAEIADEDDAVLAARRLVAQRCIYGVDKNPFAVDLGKLSLWLLTLARGRAFSFVDHAVREGDSLVGLTRDQIVSFDWEPGSGSPAIRGFVEPLIARASELRARLRSSSGDDVAARALLVDADRTLDDVRLVGDCVVACFLGSDKNKGRRAALAAWRPKVEGWLGGSGDRSEIEAFVASTLREGAQPIRCFHWEIEYPEVFDGVDATAPPRMSAT